MEFTFICNDCGTEFFVLHVGHGEEKGYGITCPVCMSETLRVYPTQCCDGEDEECCSGEDEECCCSGLYVSCGDCEGTGEEQAGCGGCCGDDDDVCDGKESCCTGCETHARFPVDYAAVMDEIRGRTKLSDLEKQYAGLDAQVEEERKIRKKEYERVLQCMRNPSMEE